MITIKRVYDPSDASDGYRVLVDRLWPRGVKRETARLDDWAKFIATSSDLRIWYGHRPERWAEFQVRYRQELATLEAAEQLAKLRDLARKGTVTLLTATHAATGNHATVLKAILAKK
jgi:uncharacterized protein YeaO (DUF488 family)